MMIHELSHNIGQRPSRKRVGRGIGTGHGKTSGRGHKGAGSRSGHKSRIVFEGGQMPLVRRLAKRGFNNRAFGTEYVLIKISDLDSLFHDGEKVTGETLKARGMNGNVSNGKLIKIVGGGTLTKRLAVAVGACTRTAVECIKNVGGTVEFDRR